MWTNEVKIGGQLFKKFDLKESAAGNPYINFTVLSTKEKKKQYTNMVAFGDAANVMEQVKEGDYLTIDGELSTSSYEKDGKKVYSTNVITHLITLG